MSRTRDSLRLMNLSLAELPRERYFKALRTRSDVAIERGG
jgi:hypothetical protein